MDAQRLGLGSAEVWKIPSMNWIIFTYFQGRLGNGLLHKFAMATEELDPPHTYVPWIVIDGESDEESELNS